MTSKVMIAFDGGTLEQIEHICSTLNIDTSAKSKGAVVSHLIAQAKQSVEIRSQFESVMDQRAEINEKVDELEDQIDKLEDEIRINKDVLSAAQRLIIHLLGATPPQ